MSQMADKVLELENVGFSYKTRMGLRRKHVTEALSDISFYVRRGETLGLIGRNGSGKSTLLTLLTGIYQPDRGVIHRHCDRIALLSLSVGFDLQLSGADNLILSCMMLGYSKRQALEHYDEIVEFAGLEEFMQQPLKAYSSGMKARLGFAVGIKMEADLLLIDEALGTGDAAFKQKASKIMRERIMSDQSVIFVSHSLGNVAELCQRVIWLEDGVIKLEGEPEPVLEQYMQFMSEAEGVGNQARKKLSA